MNLNRNGMMRIPDRAGQAPTPIRPGIWGSITRLTRSAIGAVKKFISLPFTSTPAPANRSANRLSTPPEYRSHYLTPSPRLTSA